MRRILPPAFGGSRTSLFVDLSLENSLLESAGVRFIGASDVWRLCTRGEMGTSDMNAVL